MPEISDDTPARDDHSASIVEISVAQPISRELAASNASTCSEIRR